MKAPPVPVRPEYLASESVYLDLYAGEVLVATDEMDARPVDGRLRLQVGPDVRLRVELDGPEWLAEADLKGSRLDVRLPDSVDITPPAHPGAGVFESSSLITQTLDSVSYGDPDRIALIVGHVFGFVTNQPFRQVVTQDGEQGQLVVEFAGWDVRLARVVDEQLVALGMSLAFHATPTKGRVDASRVEALRSGLFLVLSFIAGTEVGVGLLVGKDENGHHVWASWDAPRMRSRQPAIRWCPSHLVPEVAHDIAAGISAVQPGSSLYQVMDRSIQYLLVAPGPETLDVRIPVLCTGIELVAWAMLQNNDWLTVEGVGQLRAGPLTRLLAGWIGLPTAIPDHMTALRARVGRLGQPHMGMPEVVFNVRNALIHPPNSLDSPEWPSSAELRETWQCAAWLLELAILRVLGYKGRYWSRLVLGRSVWDTEPVPWSSQAL